MPNDYKTDDLVNVGITAISAVLNYFLLEVEAYPEELLRPATTFKKCLVVDLSAEQEFKTSMKDYQNGRFRQIRFYGEEKLGTEEIKLANTPGTCVLVDALDGSDLFERGLGNWCSAATFFTPSNPPGRRIRAALVGLPNGAIYYASDEQPLVYVRRKLDDKHCKPEPVSGLSKVTALKNASLCFYGQKVSSFIETAELPLWQKFSSQKKTDRDKPKRKNKRPAKAPGFRLYNLAGIPMLIKMIDQVRSIETGEIAESARRIDAVLEVCGQLPHDAVPGLFLAKKAGAVVRHVTGADISYENLENYLLTPTKSSIRYVVATTKRLSDEIISGLKKDSKATRRLRQ